MQINSVTAWVVLVETKHIFGESMPFAWQNQNFTCGILKIQVPGHISPENFEFRFQWHQKNKVPHLYSVNLFGHRDKPLPQEGHSLLNMLLPALLKIPLNTHKRVYDLIGML